MEEVISPDQGAVVEALGGMGCSSTESR